MKKRFYSKIKPKQSCLTNKVDLRSFCLDLCQKMHWKPSLLYNNDTIFFNIILRVEKIITCAVFSTKKSGGVLVKWENTCILLCKHSKKWLDIYKSSIVSTYDLTVNCLQRWLNGNRSKRPHYQNATTLPKRPPFVTYTASCVVKKKPACYWYKSGNDAKICKWYQFLFTGILFSCLYNMAASSKRNFNIREPEINL
jgi:hypothetical protein